MKTSRNQKGMTLLEIILVLLIASILFLITGSILLSSMGYFQKATTEDFRKQSADSIASILSDELMYATEVEISSTQPDDTEDWHYFSVDREGHLLSDGKVLFEADFYGRDQLNLSVRMYPEHDRMDLRVAFCELVGAKKEERYLTSFTLEFVNRKKDPSTPSTRFSFLMPILDNESGTGNRLYYKQGTLSIHDTPEDPDLPPSVSEGTVAGELQCRIEETTFAWESGVKYMKGSYVLYNGIWYRAIENVNNSRPPDKKNNESWKCLDYDWTMHSVYLIGDVVIYPSGSNSHYIRIAEFDIHDKNTYDSPENNQYWRILSEDEIEEMIEKQKEDDFCNISVGGEMERCGNEDNIKDVYQNNTKYNLGDFVEKPIGEWWRNINIEGSIGVSPGAQGVWLWKKIDIEYQPYSRYFKGDIIVIKEKYYQVLEEFVNPTYDPDIAPGLWNGPFDTLAELTDLTKNPDYINPSCKLYSELK